jgi:hypothetical protein
MLMSTFGDLMGQVSFLQNMLIECSSMIHFLRAVVTFMEILVKGQYGGLEGGE